MTEDARRLEPGAALRAAIQHHQAGRLGQAEALYRQVPKAPHLHPDGWVSGVYYVELQDAKDAPGGERAGWIEFGRPLAEFAIKAAPKVECIRPEVGRMLLFPSYFYHRTPPFESAGRRIGLAFDFMPAS